MRSMKPRTTRPPPVASATLLYTMVRATPSSGNFLAKRFSATKRSPEATTAIERRRTKGAASSLYGGQALGLYQVGQPAGFIGSVLGAVVLLVLLRLFNR